MHYAIEADCFPIMMLWVEFSVESRQFVHGSRNAGNSSVSTLLCGGKDEEEKNMEKVETSPHHKLH